MSLLPAGNSLRSYLPDLDDLLESPAEYLAVGPVVIGPQRMYRLAALFGVPGIAFLLSYWFGKQDGERIALGVGLLIGAAVWLGWSLWARGHALILHPNGVEVKHHDVSVWCPWALFHAEGVPYVPEVDSPFTGLILPVASDAVPFIELRRAESVLAHGMQVRAPHFTIVGEDEVVLTGRYEVAAKDLGELLLYVGQTLGLQLPRGAPPREAYQTEGDVIPDPDPAGWITGRATRLHFPPICCGCGTATTDALRFEVWSRGGRLMRTFVPVVGHAVTIAVPVCESCQAALRARLARGAVRGLLVGALLGPLVLLLSGWGDQLGGILGLGVAVVGALIGFALGHYLANDPPVVVRDYSPTRGTVRLRFRNPDYAATMIALMRQRRTPR